MPERRTARVSSGKATMCAPATVARRSAIDTIKPSSCGNPSNVEAVGTVTSRRQHLPVRREVRPEE
eukprot:4700828-Prymnesium_polylepis.1